MLPENLETFMFFATIEHEKSTQTDDGTTIFVRSPMQTVHKSGVSFEEYQYTHGGHDAVEYFYLYSLVERMVFAKTLSLQPLAQVNVPVIMRIVRSCNQAPHYCLTFIIITTSIVFFFTSPCCGTISMDRHCRGPWKSPGCAKRYQLPFTVRTH